MKQARNTMTPSGALWGGDGIKSRTAAAEAVLDTQSGTGITGVAIAPNIKLDQNGNVAGPLKTTFKGQTGLDTNAVLAAFTFNGDTNLDGVINFDDYNRMNNGFLSNGAKTGYWNGDVNFDGLINFDDYFVVNSAFLGQSAHTPLPPMAKVASPFSTKLLRAVTLVAKKDATKKPGEHHRHRERTSSAHDGFLRR